MLVSHGGLSLSGYTINSDYTKHTLYLEGQRGPPTPSACTEHLIRLKATLQKLMVGQLRGGKSRH